MNKFGRDVPHELEEARNREDTRGECFVLDLWPDGVVPIPGSPLMKLAEEIECRLQVRLPEIIDSRGHRLCIDEVSWVTMSAREFCFYLRIQGKEHIPFFTGDASVMAEFIVRYLEARAEAEEMLQ